MRRVALFAAVLAAVLCVCWAATEPASALYILTGEDDSVIVLDKDAKVADFSSQLVYIGSQASGFELTLTAGQHVTVLYNGASITSTTRQESISALLSRLQITPSPLDMVAVDLSETGVTLTVASDLTYYERIAEQDPYQTIYVDAPDLAEGVQETVQAGVTGVRAAVYEVAYSGGERVSRQLVSEENSTTVDEIIRVGTAVEGSVAAMANDSLIETSKNEDGTGSLTFASGAVLTFSQVKDMTATAYTSGYGGADNSTATGTAVRKGVVAVDKSVIPLGSKLYIQTADGSIVYGVAVAEDTGVRGNVIDLYYDTYEQCINFGRRPVTVYVLN